MSACSLPPSLSRSLSLCLFPSLIFPKLNIPLASVLSPAERCSPTDSTHRAGVGGFFCASRRAAPVWIRLWREGVLYVYPGSVHPFLCFFQLHFGATFKMTEEKRVRHVKLVGVCNPSPPRTEVSGSVWRLCGLQVCGSAQIAPGCEREAPGNRNGNRWLFFPPSTGIVLMCEVSLDWSRYKRTCLK